MRILYLTAAAQAAKCPFGYGSQEEAKPTDILSQQATETLPEESS